jgi:sulfite reductase beta subunit-like hemoprotein
LIQKSRMCWTKQFFDIAHFATHYKSKNPVSTTRRGFQINKMQSAY